MKKPLCLKQRGFKFMKNGIKVFLILIGIYNNGYTSSLNFSAATVFGDNDYKKYYFDLKISTDYYYINPFYTTYYSNLLDSQKEIGLKIWYSYASKAQILLNIAYVPERNGYSHYSIGGDIFYQFLKTEKVEFGVGGFINYISAKDSYYISTASYTPTINKTKITYLKSSYYYTYETEVGLYFDFLYKSFNLNLSYSKPSYSQIYDQTKRAIQRSITPFFTSSGYIDYTFSSSLSLSLPSDFILSSRLSFSKYKTAELFRSKSFSLDKDFDLIRLTLDYEVDSDDYLGEEISLYGLSLSIRVD